MDNLFIELLQVTLGTRKDLTRTPTDKEWLALFDLSQCQGISGVMLDGLERLSKEQLPSKPTLLQWVGTVQIMEAGYSLHCKRVCELTAVFKTAGFRTSVLKGIGLSQLYPHPERWQCGDIDVWVDGEKKAVMKWMVPYYRDNQIVWHHVVTNFFNDVSTEIHFHPSWLHNPFQNRRLQKWFEDVKNEQMEERGVLGFAHPNVAFNAVYSLVHTFHHLLEEGVGLRHVVDYYYILRSLPREERPNIVKLLKRFGIYKLARAMMWVLWEVCGMPYENLLCEPDKKEGVFLLNEMVSRGNLGQFQEEDKMSFRFSHWWTMLWHYPGEVLWIVPWKVWHKGWRFFNSKRIG